MPVVVTVIVEFLKLVAGEIAGLASRRRDARKLEAERKKVALEQQRRVEDAKDQYENSLILLKKKSKIQENPYGQS